MKIRIAIVLLTLSFTAINHAAAQGTAFTYQGRLTENGAPATGVYDLRFALYDAASAGNAVGSSVTNTATSVSSGLFVVTLDFGTGVFDGNARWLEVGVKSNGVAGAHVPLTPRQALTPSPYAIFARGAQMATTVATGGVSTGSIAVGAVNSSAIADNSIQTNDLNSQILNSMFWRLDGNSGPGNFLGSTDNRLLEFRVNGTPALRLAPTFSTVNILGGYSSNSVRTGTEGATISGGGAVDVPHRIEGDFSTIGGGWGNTNNAFNAFIGGGYWNRIEAGGLSFNSFIGAGAENVVGSNVSFGVVAGGRGNVISNQSQYPTIGGGRLNRAAGSFSTVGGGLRNSAEGGFSSITAGGTVAGGSDNFARTNTSFIGGGSQNTNAGVSGVIGGGSFNRVERDEAVVSGGRLNVNAGLRSVIGGGENNSIHANAGASAIGGGRQNDILTNATYAVIGGGYQNLINNNANNSTIAGGIGNTANAGATFIGGGSYNTNSGGGAAIVGGIANRAENFDAFIGAGAVNVNSGYRGFIGSGENNSISNSAPHAVIAGGIANSTEAGATFIGGGSFNTNRGGGAFIGGGIANRAENFDAIVVGGAGNVDAGFRAFIGGGEGNVISNAGSYATIPGGLANSAAGLTSFAAGRRAQANHDGAFVWADSTDASFASTSSNQFSVRAAGGVQLVTSGAGATLDGQPILSGTIGSAQLANGSVTAAKIPTGQVVKSLNSLTDAVTLTAGNNVTITPSGNALQIASSFTGPVSDSQLSANIPRLNAAATFTATVTANNAANSFSGAFAGNGNGLTNVNAATVAGLGAGSFWLTSGNAGTSAGANFVGTTDSQPLELKVNGMRALRLEPTANLDTVNVIGGSSRNFVGAGVIGATIGGGGSGSFGVSSYTNQVGGNFGTVSGGFQNAIQNALGATIGGGAENTIQSVSQYATIAGGRENTIQQASYATIGGGRENTIQTNDTYSTIAGGRENRIQNNSEYSTISGGHINTIQSLAQYATIPGGQWNSATSYAFAAGRRAKANHIGAFVWADSTDADFASTGANQFLIRASGGVGVGTRNPQGSLHVYSDNNPTVVRIQSTGTPGFGRVEFVSNPQGDLNEWRPGYIQSLDIGGFTGGFGFFVNGTGAGSKFGDVEVMRVVNGNVAVAPTAALSFGSQTRQMINLWGTGFGIGVQASTLYSRCNAGGPNEGFAWYKGGVHSDTYADPGGGVELMHLVAGGLYVNGALVPVSDRNAKENFEPVNSRDVLEKVAALPLSKWNYKSDTSTRHVGPMAQDFYAAFGVGPDNKHIATVDADGVALAAIQGLNEVVKEKDARIVALEKSVAELKDIVAKLAKQD